MRLAAAAFAAALVFAAAADARTWRIRPGPEAQQQLQTALIEAQPGDTVQLDRGRYELTQGLTLAVDRVTIRGAGLDRSVLSFANQRRGAEGLLVTASGVVLRDFAVEDTPGDGIKVTGCDGITFRNIRMEWTRGPHPENGAYGLYPVNCTDVLVEGSIVRGSSDAGIYVGQSRNIIVRNNTVELNVAGIEIENSFNADVYGNVARRNTGGILVFDLPGIPQVGGHSTRVYDNEIVDNNTPNFAPAGNIVATIPTGTGVLIMASRNVHVFNNRIGEHGTANVIVAAYRPSFTDANYNPLPRDVMIRNNRFGRTGYAPAGELEALGAAGVRLPDVMWDGATMFSVGGVPRTENVRIVMRNNRDENGGPGRFLSLGVPVAGSPFSEAAPDPAYPPLLEIEEPEPVRIRN